MPIPDYINSQAKSSSVSSCMNKKCHFIVVNLIFQKVTNFPAPSSCTGELSDCETSLPPASPVRRQLRGAGSGTGPASAGHLLLVHPHWPLRHEPQNTSHFPEQHVIKL